MIRLLLLSSLFASIFGYDVNPSSTCGGSAPLGGWWLVNRSAARADENTTWILAHLGPGRGCFRPGSLDYCSVTEISVGLSCFREFFVGFGSLERVPCATHIPRSTVSLEQIPVRLTHQVALAELERPGNFGVAGSRETAEMAR